MREPSNNREFTLLSNRPGFGPVEVSEPRDFDKNLSSYKLNEKGRYFEVTRKESVTLMEDSVDYLERLIDLYGTTPNVRLIEEAKRVDTLEEEWYTVSNDGVNLRSLSINDETNRKQGTVELITGGLLKTIEARWEDEVDITAQTTDKETDTDLPFKTVCLPARRIFRESEIRIDTTPFVQQVNTGLGANDEQAFPVPFTSTILNSDSEFFNLPSQGLEFRTVNNNYANQEGRGSLLFYQDNDRAKALNIRIRVNAQVLQSLSFGARVRIELVKFNNGLNFNYLEKTLLFEDDFISGTDIIVDETFTAESEDDFTFLEEGESLALAMWVEGTPAVGEVEFRPGTGIIITEDSEFPPTMAKVLRIYDVFAKLCDNLGYGFESTVFGPEGKYWNHFIAFGSWIRNVPQIIPLSSGGGRRIQSSVSFKEIWEAASILEPLRYDLVREGTVEKFFVGAEIETQRNYVSVALRDRDGELQEVAEKNRDRVGDNDYGKIIIGSNTSGENYEEVGNVFSTGGRGEWSTPNVDSDTTYEVTSNVRTGSEDWELTRQKQFVEESDKDDERDNDIFMIVCKESDLPGCTHEPKIWSDEFSELPRNVFSPESNYNYSLSPRFLMEAHSWKFTPGIWMLPLEFVKFNSSNCNSSLITHVAGESEKFHDANIRVNNLKRPTVKLWAYTFRTVLTQEVQRRLAGEKNGVIEFMYDGERKRGRLIEGSADGSFKVIEAV